MTDAEPNKNANITQYFIGSDLSLDRILIVMLKYLKAVCNVVIMDHKNPSL
jgi:hypothetical protein